eukprot:UN05395
MGCTVMAYAPKIIPWIFYAVYLVLILLRTELSFRGSYLALSRTAIYLLSALISVQLFILMPLFLILNKQIPICGRIWNPADGLIGQLSYCDLPIMSSPSSTIIFMIQAALTVILIQDQIK